MHRAAHQGRTALFAASLVVLNGVRAFLRTGDLPGLTTVALPAPAFRIPNFPVPKP